VPAVIFTAQIFFNCCEKKRMIRVQNLCARFTGFALQDICLTVEKGEFFSLLGPTGAGKTLILESIAGLVQPSEGRIWIGGRDVTCLPPEKRGVGIVYQDQALFPHLSVRENIFYGLRYRRKSGNIQNISLDSLVKNLRLTHLLDRSVHDLSGGEKQRVALARALAIDPAVLLLDEPLSSLDPNFREEIRQLLKDLHGQTAITVLMVTHDFSEAHFLAQRAAIIHNGHLEQVGDISSVFHHPATPFVADFVGMKNILEAVFNADNARVKQLDLKITGSNHPNRYIAIRPENIHLSRKVQSNPGSNCFAGTVVHISNQGFYADLDVATAGILFRTVMTASALLALNIAEGEEVFLSIDPENIHVI
jgi:molybdate/tungstate transport system ATP-binding protein